ncbi:MAG: deoxyribodipyrimidine photo-lyase [Alphaproteobacteria bacterium]
MIQNTRVRSLNDAPRRNGGAYVLYWMQEAQRAHDNAALDLAIAGANKYGLPVVAAFGLTDDYPEANARHYAFMLEGLADCAAELPKRGVEFVVRRGPPVEAALALAPDAAAVICDRSYFPAQKRWRKRLAEEAGCAVAQVETETVVPVEIVSGKSEYAARTIRPKIHRHWDEYLVAPDEQTPEKEAAFGFESDLDVSDPEKALAALDLDVSVAPVRRFRGGQSEARRRLADFTVETLPGYADGRNEPADGRTSFLSPYLHFGHISPVEMALAARQSTRAGADDRDSFVEELVVRRELSINYIEFEPDFASYDALPDWARRTLANHAGDPREHLYDREELAACDTHDPYWNAAMREMVHTGFMHNYMRMYWAKKILEWSPTPRDAFETTLALNNRYFLDGRDPNSWANVAWCYGLHDRAWTERPIFGKIRYMNANGLNRKFDMEAYIVAVDGLVEAESR